MSATKRRTAARTTVRAASAQRIELLMRAINEGVYDWDIAGDTIYYSDWVRRAVGLSEKDLRTPADWRNRIHPEDVARFDAALVAHFKSRTERFECEFRFRAGDGSWHWARQHGFCVRNRQGRAVRLIGSTGDITELKQATEALRISEERYALAMRAATEGVYEWDVDRGRLYISDTTKVFFWSKTEALTPEAWNARLHPEDFERYRGAIAEHFRGRTSQFECEYRIRDASGGYLWVLDRGIGVRDAGGRVLRFVGAVSDVTQRRQAEEALRLAHQDTAEALERQRATSEVLASMSASMSDAQPVFDRIVRNIRRLLGTRFAVLQLLHGDTISMPAIDGDPEFERLRERYPLPLDDTTFGGRTMLTRRIVQLAPVIANPDTPSAASDFARDFGFDSVLFAPMIHQDRVIGALGTAHPDAKPFDERQIALIRTFADQAVIAIENVRLFNDVQAKSRQLEAANRHKSEFLANMSHELRTPLNAIIGFSEVLGERYFGELTEKQDEYVKDIHSSGRHLLSLINDILDLSKIEAGRMELELAEFELRPAIDNALTLVKERAQRHRISLAFEAALDLGAIRADERKLKQILLNLLSNAVKFTPDGGSVRVSAKRNGGTVEIAVADTGPGIAPEDQAAVFEEFKQVGPSNSAKAEGTGLGMPLTRKFVELHGGTIRLESALGKGATFTVSLPVAR